MMELKVTSLSKLNCIILFDLHHRQLIWKYAVFLINLLQFFYF